MQTLQAPASQATRFDSLPKEVLMKIMRMVEADARESGVGRCPVNFLLRYRGLSTTFRNAVDALVASFECDIPAFEGSTPSRESLRMGSPLSRATLSLERLFRRWPALTSLNVRSDWPLDYLQCVIDLVANCHSLQRLSLDNLQTPPDPQDPTQPEPLSLRVLAPLPNFHTLSLLNFPANRKTTSSLTSLASLSDLTIKSPTIFAGIQFLPSLTRLAIDAKYDTSDFAYVLYPVRVSPRLIELSLGGICLHPELPPTLRRLRLRDFSTSVGLRGPALPELLELDMLNVDGRGLQQLLTSCRELTSLRCSNVGMIDDVTLSQLTNLKVLRLDTMHECEMLPSLSELTTLEVLHLADFRNDMPAIGSLRSLHSLTLKKFYELDFLAQLGDLTALVSLHIDSYRAQRDCRALSLLTALTDLHLSSLEVPELPDLQSLRRLKSLRLVNLEKLESVDSFDRENVGGGGGRSIWAELPCLTSLELHGVPCLRQYALEHSGTLVSLTLGGEQEVPSLAALTALESLSFTKCPTLQAVDALQGLEQLSSLSISECSNLRSVHLPPLPRLRSVEISACPSLAVVEGPELLPRFATVTLEKVRLRMSL